MPDFSGIPDHAVRKDEDAYILDPYDSTSFSAHATVVTDENGTRAFVGEGLNQLDVTEAWTAWIQSKPVKHSVTFEWYDDPEETKQ